MQDKIHTVKAWTCLKWTVLLELTNEWNGRDFTKSLLGEAERAEVESICWGEHAGAIQQTNAYTAIEVWRLQISHAIGSVGAIEI